MIYNSWSFLLLVGRRSAGSDSRACSRRQCIGSLRQLEQYAESSDSLEQLVTTMNFRVMRTGPWVWMAMVGIVQREGKLTHVDDSLRFIKHSLTEMYILSQFPLSPSTSADAILLSRILSHQQRETCSLSLLLTLPRRITIVSNFLFKYFFRELRATRFSLTICYLVDGARCCGKSLHASSHYRELKKVSC